MVQGQGKFVGGTGRAGSGSANSLKKLCDLEISAARQFESHSLKQEWKNVNGF
jgi:hypothetical protein